jgi:hypothetical protein
MSSITLFMCNKALINNPRSLGLLPRTLLVLIFRFTINMKF